MITQGQWPSLWCCRFSSRAGVITEKKEAIKNSLATQAKAGLNTLSTRRSRTPSQYKQFKLSHVDNITLLSYK